jgi:hypothetical protein
VIYEQVTYPRSYMDAMDVLNARRAGVDMPEGYVLKALELTGDYVPEKKYQAKDFKPLFKE